MGFTKGGLRTCCAHCGLPLAASGAVDKPLYCCHACRLVAGIVGSGNDGERAWHTLRLGIGALLAMNIMMISLLLYTDWVEAGAVDIFRHVLLALSLPAMGILLYPFVSGAFQELREGRTSLDTLVAGGSLAAFAVSAVNTLSRTGHIYFDTATMLPVLVTVGRLIESSARTKAAHLLQAVDLLLPATALLVDGEGTREVPVGDLRPGDMVRIRPGERIAVDGRIREGCTVIEETAFTGEAGTAFRGCGDRVLAGTINGHGSLLVVAEEVGAEVLLQRIVALTEAALRNPARIERLAEKLARGFVPLVLLISVAAAAYWSMSGDPVRGGLSALAILVVACPCTLGIATPLATSLAIACAARAGVAVRGGDVMERIGEIGVVFFDKSGTVTESDFHLQRIEILDPETPETELLGKLAALESGSEHVIAGAIVAAARSRGIPVGTASGIVVTPGKGISGTVIWEGKECTVNAETARSTEADMAEEWGSLTVVTVSWGGTARGRLSLSAPLRADAAACVSALHQQGIATVLLSGDRYEAAAAVAQKTGIEKVEAPRTPEEKQAVIRNAMGGSGVVAMVGDGINDAPALALAPVGFALGPIDLARHSANVALLSGRLTLIPWVIGLSRSSRRIVRQNFAWSFGYNAIAICAAAAGILHPLIAAGAMVASSISVICNSLRISNYTSGRALRPEAHQSRMPNEGSRSCREGADVEDDMPAVPGRHYPFEHGTVPRSGQHPSQQLPVPITADPGGTEIGGDR
ncbi:Cu2+-exporting ATPase [Geobacter sp. DSM 9736]|nr:Cu2+-exporting ATPase [Geobacter sp. DSM 9736]